jgi:hypothetical protein
MNRDSHLIFEAYKNRNQKLINEADIGADFGPVLGAVTSGVSEREKSADTYIFKLLKSKNPDKTHDEIVKMVVEPLYKAIFVDNKFAAHGTHKDQLAKLQTALENELAKTYPKAQSGYTARIIKNFLTPVVKILDADSSNVTGGKEAVKAVIQAVDKAAAENEVVAPQEPGEPSAAEGEHNVSSSDRTTAQVQQIVDGLIDDQGVIEKYVHDDAAQKIRDSGGLGIGDDRAIAAKVKTVINDLVKAGVYERKGQTIKLGKNYDDFEQHRGSAEPFMSDVDVIDTYTGGNKPVNPFKGSAGDSMFG